MRAAGIVIAVLLASAARAQTSPSEGTSQDKPADAPAPRPATAPSTLTYEPGVGLRYKTPRTTVALFAVLEPTISTVDNADAAGHRQTGYQVSWFSGNRWGLTGSQSLTGDGSLKAIFRLESEFELPTGNMDTPGVLFNRDAWAGFDGKLGKLTFGRQNTLPRDFSQNYGDPYGTAGVTLEEGGWTNVNNFKQLIFFAGSATGTRYDDGVVWKKRFGEHVVAGLGYQFGGVAGQFAQGSTGAAALALNLGALNASAFINEANNQGLTQRSFSAGGNYQIAFVRLNGGYFRYEANQGALGHRKDDAFTVSTKIAPIAEHVELDAGYQRISVRDAAYGDSGKILNPFRDTSAATTTGSGAKHTAYGSLIYHFNTLTQVYLALDYTKVTQGYRTSGAVAGDLGTSGPSDNPTGWYASQTEVAAGMRLIF